MNTPGQNSNHAPDNAAAPATPAPLDAVARANLKASFSPDTPAEIRDRVLDVVFAVLNGEDDD
jgi:hypothetical protein